MDNVINFIRPATDPDLRIMIPERTNGSQHSTESDDEVLVESPRPRRHYKTYTIMQRSGFQHTEYVQIITHLCKAEILISTFFLAHGFTCPGYKDELEYQGTCHINVLSALVGIFTGGMGLGAVHR
ncbi:Protein F37C4.4 a [Aphelenchoides avenae]|nr:Protein F37C4.4 a [Aphelenchus avenae]